MTMKTNKLKVGKKYHYKGKEVAYKGLSAYGFSFFEFETEADSDGKKTIYPLWEHEVNEEVSELNVIKEWK